MIFVYDSDCIVDVVMWPKFSNTSISSYKDLTRKTFFEGWSWNLGFVLSIAMKHRSSVANGFKQILKRFWGLIAPFRETTWTNQ